ncbi:hypothetical protein BDY17DRAFT_349761 [Neohortaea acidophila]|uniref:[histone H3]-trimethyl-L-lysine(9) demethylase n=1 Tax=Neohortaea acidophila TaxID=245834 RepID=A0A6A6PFJ5_9PEZI|nr:uncharacterized protein BDY17DRAFT_349761 [Neohortaea acidophila]KAF2478732.1 hypothetical protein BDY17DRAFT_349761 [Neohortaea acidophila]
MQDVTTSAPAAMGHAPSLSPTLHAAKPSIEPVGKPANALTPPTSEELNNPEPGKELDESDLSELDLSDDDDGEEIEPDHYWDDGKIPVFKPTMDQFRSFKKFIEKIDKYGMKSGIVKVIPPPEWRQDLPKLDEYVKRIKIKNPITQEFNGTQGIYTQQNVEKQRSYNLPEWKALTQESQYQHPARRGERRRNQAQVVRGGGSVRARQSTAAAPDSEDGATPKRKPGRPKRNTGPAPEPDSEGEAKGRRSSSRAQATPAPSTPTVKPAEKKPKGKPGRPAGSKNGTGAGQTKSVTSRRLNNTAEAAEYIDEKAFHDFEYGLDDLDEFTPERCAELETHYWKSLGFNQPMYAADMPGSLFDDSVTSWNVAKLENLLDVLGTKVPGVNTAYLYMGMWKATFAWHLEDVDLYSINYIHFGAPKQWYSISQEDARKFEKAMKAVWPVDAKNCDQFLRHKTYLISPDVLQKQYGVKVNKLVHYEGEFVITFPYGYHSGYNVGYNCAESVNFATESWLEYGRIARKCNCESDNVWVDVFEIERKLRGEPTPEYIEETDDDSDLDGEDGNLPTPPASVKGKPSKKRKRGKQEEPKKKKKIRIRVRIPTREPCVMCPNDNPWEPLISTDNGKKVHRSCALFTPETWIVKDDNTGAEMVCGVTTIDRARLDLKCNYCRSKRGACFQCSSRKCTRAFHATCALAAGVQIDAGMVPTFGEDGTEYFEEGYDFRCKFHRPKQAKNLTTEMLESGAPSKRIAAYGKEVKVNDVVQAQMVGGDVFAGLVIENRVGEMSLLVDVLPDGDRLEVEYKYLLVLDPEDSQRPKPSASALPMPEGMNKKAVSINNRQDGVPIQDEPFHNNPDYKWHDFYNHHTPPPGYLNVQFQAPMKLEVNIDKPDQLYFYLGEASTEAKCFFSDKPGSKEIVAKANFMDRMQPKAPSQPFRPSGYGQLPKLTPKSAAAPQPIRSHKPYIYKPRTPLEPRGFMYQVDRQALANQRSFLAESVPARGSAPSSLQQMTNAFQLPRYGFEGAGAGSPPGSSSGPLRAFPTEQYYSMKMLPAAYPGQHSGFTQAARRESQGAQTMTKPDLGYTPNYQSIREQQAQMKQSQAGASMTNGASASGLAMPPNPYEHHGSRPSSSLDSSYQSPYATPLMPGTTQARSSTTKEGPPTDEEYLANLRRYPYLLKSYCRKPKVYESPYPLGGGFNSAYLSSHSHERNTEPPKSSHVHTPHGSIGSLAEAEKLSGQQWTPPSQVWDRVGLAKNPTPPLGTHQNMPPQHQQPRYPQPTYSTAQEFQRQIQVMPSTASRDGAQARMLRDQGYVPHQQQQQQQPQPPAHWYGPHHHQQQLQHQQRSNSFGHQGYDTARMEQYGPQGSPKAPTPSPLSENPTPGQTPGGARSWEPLPRMEMFPNAPRASADGYESPAM